MRNELQAVIKKVPFIRDIAKIAWNFVKKIRFSGSKEYWENRYLGGGTSGEGSFGRLAKFKAEIVNTFVKNNDINSVIEFGCGDGNQLSLLKIIHYTGLDISKTAIRKCIEQFKKDKTKSFFLYKPEYFDTQRSVFKAELSLSLDVIYHLIEDKMFEYYMKHLFSASNKFVIIYSSNTDLNKSMPPHCKNRIFTKWIETNLSQWKLIRKIKNRYPQESISDFFIYKIAVRQTQGKGIRYKKCII